MQRILVVMCFLVMLVGCSDNVMQPEPRHELFSNDKDRYSLLVVDELKEYDIGYEWGEKHNLNNFNTVRVEYSLEAATNSYKFLELEKSPTFVVFDMEGAVFKTDSEEELIDFLKDNNPNEK